MRSSSSLELGAFTPAFAAQFERLRMRVGEIYRKAVVFVGIEGPLGFVPLGTACLYSLVYRELEFIYLVTAAHVIDSARGDTVAVRVNLKAGGCGIVHFKKEWFILPENKANDIVLSPAPLPNLTYDYATIDLGEERYRKDLENWSPACGEEVVTIGLYTSHYGMTKNIPVIRIGHIAAMLDEPVQTDAGYVQGYLVEMKSIAGLSGSPVFGNPPEVRVKDGKLQKRDGYIHVPVGTLVGYHIVESREDQIEVPQFQGLLHDDLPNEEKPTRSADERATGFAVVIPIERVMELVQGDLMKNVREQAANQHFGKGYRKASAEPPVAFEAKPAKSEPPAIEGDDRHKERFTALLDGAVGKPKQGA